MAGGALASQPRVIHYCRFKCSEICMAGIALCAGGDMGCWFAECRCAVVTGSTGAGCRRSMNISGAGPSNCRVVAGITLRCGCQVGRCFGLSIDGRVSSTVASRTISGCNRACCIAVAHGRWRKGRRIGVAGVTLGSRWNVIGWLAQRRGAVVAS